MIRYVLVILAPLLLGLGACSFLPGAGAAIGMQALSVAGQGTIRAIERDTAAAQRWTVQHDAAVAVYMQACLANAQRLALGDDWALADAAFKSCLETSVENMPTLLIERVKTRIDRSFSEKGAEGKPE